MMTDSPPSMAPPPGWYADSPTSTRLRWWNGTVWTDHYQAQTEAVPVVAPPTAEVTAPPMTRAERRAAVEAAQHAAVDAAPSPPAPSPPPVVKTTEQPSPAVADDVPAERPAAARLAEAFPDQIMDRTPRMGEYRPPLAPVTYRPPPGAHVASTRATYVAIEQRNGPARASLVLILISLLGGVAVLWFISGADPALIGIVNLINGAILLTAFLLAVIAVVVSVQRPTRKREPVFALVMSSLLIVGTIVVFTARVVAAGLVGGAG
jgi:hypothetical protein